MVKKSLKGLQIIGMRYRQTRLAADDERSLDAYLASVGGGARIDGGDRDAPRGPVGGALAGREILDRDPEVALPHLAVGDEVLRDAPRAVDGDREADPGAPVAQDRGVHADEAPLDVEEGARATA